MFGHFKKWCSVSDSIMTMREATVPRHIISSIFLFRINIISDQSLLPTVKTFSPPPWDRIHSIVSPPQGWTICLLPESWKGNPVWSSSLQSSLLCTHCRNMHVIAPHGPTHVVETAAHALISPSAVVQEGCPDSQWYLFDSKMLIMRYHFRLKSMYATRGFYSTLHQLLLMLVLKNYSCECNY